MAISSSPTWTMAAVRVWLPLFHLASSRLLVASALSFLFFFSPLGGHRPAPSSKRHWRRSSLNLCRRCGFCASFSSGNAHLASALDLPLLLNFSEMERRKAGCRLLFSNDGGFLQPEPPFLEEEDESFVIFSFCSPRGRIAQRGEPRLPSLYSRPMTMSGFSPFFHEKII